jgi:hypothetical protein
VEFTLLFVGLFMEGLGWVNLQLMIPSTTVTETSGTTNIVLAYFLITFLYGGIAALQICKSRLTQSEEDFFEFGFPCLRRTSSTYAASAISPSLSLTKPSTATTSTAETPSASLKAPSNTSSPFSKKSPKVISA